MFYDGLENYLPAICQKMIKLKFSTIFSYARWLVYAIIFLIAIDSIGINVTAVFAASAALLIGIGLALYKHCFKILYLVFLF